MSTLSVRLRPVPSLMLLPPVMMAAVLLFAVAFDQGQLSQVVKAAAGDSTVHEFFHDSRHMLGFPCH
jgi:Probable cobalt transporter subunit (CbtB)